ncbi:MAG: histone [Candidatus Aenigmarchaeota archaeon]|nr:histone [Candidatus Aenigmarchaeota archaeon]
MLPIAAMARVIRKAGVKRVSADAIKELEKTVSGLAIELASDSAEMARHAGRKTIKKEDILLASGKA